MKLSLLLLPLLQVGASPLPVAEPSLLHTDLFQTIDGTSADLGSSSVLNGFLAQIVALFPVNIVVNSLTGLITTGEQGLAVLAHSSTTENDLVGGAACADITVIFARGTTEAGNVGLLVGPPFFDALKAAMGGSAKLAVQGVDYPADVEGFLKGGDEGGSQKLADLVQQALQKCPSTKVVMSGYSQGGQLVHKAANILPTSAVAAVSSVVIFGDPDFGQAVQGASASKTLVVCHNGDNICEHGDLILVPHLTYGLNANQAAAFVIANAGAIGS